MTGAKLYAAYAVRNNWEEITPFGQQAEAVRIYWNEIAHTVNAVMADALAALRVDGGGDLSPLVHFFDREMIYDGGYVIATFANHSQALTATSRARATLAALAPSVSSPSKGGA